MEGSNRMPEFLISLIEFDRGFLSPILSRLRSTSNGAGRDFVLGELTEAYFWICLGVELTAFPAREAELLIGHRFTEMFSEWEGLFRRRGYLFAPSFETRLRASENQKRLIEIEPDRFANPAAFVGLFHHALSLETESVSDLALTTFFAALSVLRRGDLNRILTESHNLEGILFSNVDEPLLVSAFVDAARHMDCFRVVEEISRTDAVLSPYDAAEFRSRIRELTRWRLNFRVDNVRDFVPTVASRCNSTLPDEYRIGGPELSQWLDRLISDWGYTHEIFATA
jgi:hypothetical protein